MLKGDNISVKDFISVKHFSSRDLLYNVVTKVNNAVFLKNSLNWVCVSVAEVLPCMHKALSLIYRTTYKHTKSCSEQIINSHHTHKNKHVRQCIVETVCSSHFTVYTYFKQFICTYICNMCKFYQSIKNKLIQVCKYIILA